MAKSKINNSKMAKKSMPNTKARLNTKRTIKTAKAKNNMTDKSLSPVVMKIKERVPNQIKNKSLSDSNNAAPKSPFAKRGRPPKSPVVLPEAHAQKSDHENNTKSVERVIDIKEIKQQAQKILKEKQQNRLPLETTLGSRVSLRNKPLTPLSISPPESKPPRGRGRPKVIQTISDGPTVNLLTQNKIIQKTLPKDLRNVQKKLLEKQIENKKNTSIKNYSCDNSKKKVASSASKNGKLNQKIIEKLSKMLLKRKVMTKSQLITLVSNQSEFQTITLFASLLKQSKKIVMEGPKNEWNVSSKDDEEEEEEEEEDSFEMVDDEDEDKDYVPPDTEQRQFQRDTRDTPTHRIANNFNTSTPLQTAFPKTLKKSTLPATYKRKKNTLSEGSRPLYPLNSIQKLTRSDDLLYPLNKKLTPSGNATVSPSTAGNESSDLEESVSSIRALIEQTRHTASASTPQRGSSRESGTPSAPAQHSLRNEQDDVLLPAYYCDVCNKAFRTNSNLKSHRSTWSHKFSENAALLKKAEKSSQASRERKLQLMSQIKKEMISNMAAQIRYNDSIKGESPKRIFNQEGCDKFILDSELNLSLVVDSLNLILTNDVEDDEDAYDTLQMALGASDADMEILKHLAGQTIIADYMYDNSNSESNEGIFDPNESALLIEDFRHDQIDIDLETKPMGCPSTECNRTFFGLIGLQTHVKYYHPHEVFLQRKTSYRHLLGPQPLKFVCFVCKEMFPDVTSRDAHVTRRHVVIESKNLEDKARLVDTFREIFEFTLRRCVANAEKKSGKSGEQKSGGRLESGDQHKDEVEMIDLTARKVEDTSESEDDSYDDVTLLGTKFVRKLCAMEDGQRAYDLLSKLSVPSEENGEFVNQLIVKLHKILGKVVRSTLLPISNQMVISSRQQHNMFNSDSRERRFVCPLCGLRFLAPWMRNKHLTRAHKDAHVKMVQLSDDEVLDCSKLGLNESSSRNSVSRSMSPDRLKLTSLDKVGVLNELKIRMNQKIRARGKEKADEDAILALEEEYLQEEEELRALESEYLDIMHKKNPQNESAAETGPGPKNIQQVIQEIQTSLKPVRTPRAPASPHKPPPYVKVNNNFKCRQCDRLFIREDELFHHNRLEHADKSLASKLDDLRRKGNTASDGVGISPIKPVEIIMAPEEGASQATPTIEELAPLLTRKELQQSAPPTQVEKGASQPGNGKESPVEVTNEKEVTGKALIVGNKTKEVVFYNTNNDGDRRRIILNNGLIDKVMVDDHASLIQFKDSVKVTSLSNAPGPRPPIRSPAGGIQQPAAPIIKTPFASKLVSKLRSELGRKNAGLSSAALVGSSRESLPGSHDIPPANSSIPSASASIPSSNSSSPLANASIPSTSASIPSSTGSSTPGTSSQPTTPGSANVRLKRGPRKDAIPEQVRLSALAQLRALSIPDGRKRKRNVSTTAGQRSEVTEIEEDSEEEREMEFEEDGGVLLTNSASWRRVAEVDRDWETSDEEEEEEKEEKVSIRVTRGKRKS